MGPMHPPLKRNVSNGKASRYILPVDVIHTQKVVHPIEREDKYKDMSSAPQKKRAKSIRRRLSIIMHVSSTKGWSRDWPGGDGWEIMWGGEAGRGGRMNTRNARRSKPAKKVGPKHPSAVGDVRLASQPNMLAHSCMNSLLSRLPS